MFIDFVKLKERFWIWDYVDLCVILLYDYVLFENNDFLVNKLIILLFMNNILNIISIIFCNII